MYFFVFSKRMNKKRIISGVTFMKICNFLCNTNHHIFTDCVTDVDDDVLTRSLEPAVGKSTASSDR